MCALLNNVFITIDSMGKVMERIVMDLISIMQLLQEIIKILSINVVFIEKLQIIEDLKNQGL